MGILRLYQVEYQPTDNFYIEDIEHYLSQLPSTSKRYTFDNLNYLQLDLNITIKLPVSQTYQIQQIGNYAVITQDDINYYYFIVSANWVAKNTVELSLTMDTLQTFYKKLKWSAKTQIVRETRDRLKKLNTNYYIRKIDRYNEGLNPAINKQVNEYRISESGIKWYLVYMSNPATTQDITGNPMFMGLLADKSYLIAKEGTGTDPKQITIEKDKIYWLTDSGVGDNAYVQIGNTQYKLGETKENKTKRVIAVYTTGSVISYKEMWYTGDTYPYSYSEGNSWKSTLYSGYNITLNNVRVIHQALFTDYNNQITSLDKIDALSTVEVNAGKYPALRTVSFKNFDNSNQRLSKIIELPYQPVTSTVKDSIYSFDNCTFNYGYNILQINSDTLGRLLYTDNRLQDILYVTINNPTAKDKPNINLESKLYSSEFYDYSYYYDVDKLPIRLEDIDTENLTAQIAITYYQTTTMNSDKQFEFQFVNADYQKNQPYELFLNSTRSTEKMVLNDSYADYIKNGYNYDQWANKQQTRLAGANAAINLIQAGVGVFGGLSGIPSNIANIKETRWKLDFLNRANNTKGKTARLQNQINKRLSEESANLFQQYTSVVSGVGGLVLNQGISAINSAANAITSIESNRKQFENNVSTRANQPIGASGTIPTDLMNNYCHDNMFRYEYTSKDNENIWNMFRVIGYSHPLQELPQLNTRIYSNFIQCNPVFLPSDIYDDYLDDIKQRFQAGVTVKHNYEGNYDLFDEYENYETFVMEAN